MMTKFFYIVRDYQQGNLIKGSLVANNKLEVIDYLRREQYLIIAIHNNDIYSIKEYIKSIGKDEKITNKQVILLCQQLSIILESGIDIIEALKIVKDNLRDKNIKNFIEKTIIGLNEGENLSAIWQKKFQFTCVFNKFNKYSRTYRFISRSIERYRSFFSQRI